MSEENKISPEEIPQEQLVNNEPTDKTVSSAETIAEAEQLSTINSQPLTEENMEVHHHTHESHGNPPAGRAGKNWKNYFWEFLMLFLAVFCGFLAEYQLEHTIENQREKKYIHLLIEDLKADTADLESYVQLRKEKRIMMDSLMMLLNTGMHKQMGNATYFFARHVFYGQPFVSTDGTMQQLKNAGNLRLIKNENVISNILTYDGSVKKLKEWDESDTRIKNSFREMGGNIFNADLLYRAMDSDFKFVRPTNNPQLITDNKIAINNISFQLQYLTISTLGNIIRGNELKSKATKLIELLKKEYHLK